MGEPHDDEDARILEDRQIKTMVRWLLTIVFIVMGYWLVSALTDVLAPLLAAAGIAYLLDPLADRLERRGMRRSLACLLILLTFIAVLIGAIALLVPMMSRDVTRFIAHLPGMIDQAAAWVARTFGYEVPTSWRDYLEGEHIQEFLKSSAGPLAGFAASMVGGAFSFLGQIAELLLIPVFSFYLLVNWDHTMGRILLLIPGRHRDGVRSLASDIDTVVSGWLRGQFTVVAMLAFLYAVSFSLIGIQLAIPIGLLVGLLTIIPFVGTFVGAAITTLVVLLDWHGPGMLAAVGGVFLVLHLLEASVLTPVLVGKRVGLGEAGALFAVVAGGKLLGFTGILLAVPLAASVAVIIRRAVSYYEHSGFYTDGEAAAAAVGVVEAAEVEAEREASPVIAGAVEPGPGQDEGEDDREPT